MKNRYFKLFSLGGEAVVGALWIGVFAVYLLPPIRNSVNNMLSSFNEAQALSSEGIELDLIAQGNTTTETSSSVDNDWILNSDDKYAIAGQITTVDPRAKAIYYFLTDKDSPMAPYAESFVNEADRYGLDWRILVSISGIESVFGKITPYNSYNGWGWKGDPTRDFSVFSSWNDAIATISERIAKGYSQNPDPFDIESTYCPPCGRTAGHPWANAVWRYMLELDKYLQRELKK